MNRVEWVRAQDLLLKLVQTLTPLTNREESTSLVLSKRFFIPPMIADGSPYKFPFRYPVSVLSTLHKEVEKLIQDLPGQEGKEPLAPSKGETKSAALPEKKAASQPISKQAQRLIDQVQDAIGKLCHSTNMKDPKEEPLRETLKRLKPNLERIIEAVAHEGMHSTEEGMQSPLRSLLPRSPREHILKKLISFPETELKPAQKTAIRAEVKREGPPIRPKELKREETLSKADPKTRDLPKSAQRAKSQPQDLVETKAQPKESEQPHFRSVDRTVIPGAPFTSQTRALTPGKKKKKRKSFWFREEKEDPSEDPSKDS